MSLDLNGFNSPKNFSNWLIKQTPTWYFYVRDIHKHSSLKSLKIKGWIKIWQTNENKKNSIPNSKSWGKKKNHKANPKKHKEGNNEDTCRNDVEKKIKLIKIVFP